MMSSKQIAYEPSPLVWKDGFYVVCNALHPFWLLLQGYVYIITLQFVFHIKNTFLITLQFVFHIMNTFFSFQTPFSLIILSSCCAFKCLVYLFMRMQVKLSTLYALSTIERSKRKH